ncbi:WD40 repeat domain-containing protein [Kitasatospora sp. KL5]|uniref:WD40 repeat domain-containing protein n=1 Tax=Kitasatospora sp. KL5 TaxID=3425125 RepID=UPI003D6F274B
MSGDFRSDVPVRGVASVRGRLTDPGWLVKGDPEQVMAALEGAVGPKEVAAAAVYRASGHVHRDAGAQVRRQLLALDAARYGNRELVRGLTEVPLRQEEDDSWAVQWATGTGLDSRLRYALSAPAEVTAVATVVVEGRGLAVAGCEDGTLHWWDPATGEKLGRAATDHTGGVRDLATAVLDGRPVAVTGGSNGTVRVWDLAEGEPVGEVRADDGGRIVSLATAPVEGRPVVVAGSTDGMLRVWDLAALTRSGELLTIHTGNVQALATAVVDGRPVAVTGHAEGAIRRWDLITGRELRTRGDDAGDSRPVTDPASDRPTAAGGGNGGGDGMRRCVTPEINAMTHLLATDPAFECPVAIGANTYATYVRNLATGEQVGEPGPGFAQAAALTVLHGRPTALVGFALRGPVAVWDLSARRHLHRPLTGHEGTVRGAATAVVQGCHLAVTGGDDRSVRIWDLDGEKEADSRPAGHAGPVQKVTAAVVDGRCVIVTGGSDTKVRIWDLDGGAQLGAPLTGHTAAVDLLTVGTVEGRPTLLTRDRHETVHVWDLATREQLHGRSTSEYTSPFIRSFAAVEGRFVAVTSEGRVWDLAAGAWIGVQPKQGGALALETLEGRNVILTGHRTETVQLWDMATGEQTGPPMTGHTGTVSAGAAGMLDGRLIVAAGSGDGTVRVWHATTGRQIGTYAFPAAIGAMAVAPDGRLVVGFGSDIAVLTHR